MTITAPSTTPEQVKHPDDTGWPACVLYLRLSDARNENGSFDEREKALRGRAALLRWRVVRVVVENDAISGDGMRSARASAFKRRRVTLPDGRVKLRVFRPGFRSILDDLAAGRTRALLAEDLDRTMRDPRDLEDLIDVVQAVKGHADSLSGSLRFTAGGTDSELTMARIMVAVANKSSRDTARRVSDGRKRKAAEHGFGGGRRPFGFGVPKLDANGVPVLDKAGRPDLDYNAIVPAEAAEIVAWADQVLAGVPLRSVARDLIGRDVPTVTGNRWMSQTVRDILLRPRNAGHVVHRSEAARERSRNATDPADKLPTLYTDDEFKGKLTGDPILPDDVWRAVVARLTDPAATVTWTTERGTQRTAVRGTNVGRAPTYLGTGLYLCHCGQTVGPLVSKTKARAYRCNTTGTGHVVRNLAKVDAMVVDVIVERLSRPDAVDLLAAPVDPDVDVVALRAKVKMLTQRKSDLATDFADGVIDRAQLAAGTARIGVRLDAASATLAAQTDRSPLSPLLGAADVRAGWDALSLGAQRAIVADLLVVKILPTTTRGSHFDPRTVSIDEAPRGR